MYHLFILFFICHFKCFCFLPLNNSSEIENFNETILEINLINSSENLVFKTADFNINDNLSSTILPYLNKLNITLSTPTPPSNNFTFTEPISDLPIKNETNLSIQILNENNVINSTNFPVPIMNSLISNLTIKCLPNQELKSCGSLCPPTCAIQEPICNSTKNCIKDICQCKKGFVAHENGTCIHPSNCSKSSTVKTCPSNSHLSPCGNLCAPTCKFPNPTICSLQCIVDDCICDKGFVLDDESHKCVKLEECPMKKKICGQNETFQECGTKCEGTCNQPFPGFCSDECIKNICQCSEGFVRDLTGKCILLSKCLL